MSTDWDARIAAILQPLAEIDGELLERLEGCSDADIEQLERKWKVRLPPPFVALMKRAGRDWGLLMKGEDFSYPEMLEYGNRAERALSYADEDLSLEKDDFVFIMHQGSHFMFFRTGEVDDPPVFLYNADEEVLQKVTDSFTEWLAICVAEECELRGCSRR